MNESVSQTALVTSDESDECMPGLALDPIWRQAAKDAFHEFSYGDIIPGEWLRQAVHSEIPSGLLTAEQHQQLAFDFLQKFDGFRTVLLEEYKWMLLNERGVGYRIVRPIDQTEAAMEKFRREFYRAWSQAMANLVHINESMLSLEQARSNAEAKAKLGWFKTTGVKQIGRKTERKRDA